MSSIQIKDGSTINLAGDQHHKTSQSPASPHQLATMTNVNVLDLHKDYGDATKVYDKETNTVYVYSHNHKPMSSSQAQEVVESMIESQSPITSIAVSSHSSNTGGMLQRISSANTNNNNSHENHVSHIIDGRLITPTDPVTTHLSRGPASDVPITRLVDDQFIQRLVENQEVVSRDFVNGEHHIITRNENGEHILTRIVQNTDPKLMASNDNGYDSMPPPAPPILGDKHHSGLSSLSSESNLKQVIYTHGDKGEILYADAKSGEVYSAINQEDGAKNHVEMIYTEDGNKTVIYTTAGSGADQKTVELYQTGGGELGIIGENQVIIQGGLQYTAQPGPNGTTVYVLSEMHDGDDGNGMSRYVKVSYIFLFFTPRERRNPCTNLKFYQGTIHYLYYLLLIGVTL